MVKILSLEELQTMPIEGLKTHIKEMEIAGFPISWKNVKAEGKDKDDVAKFYRKKIRHAQKNPPVKKSLKITEAPMTERYVELWKLNKKSKKGEEDLCTIAKNLRVKGYTTMNKEGLINAIIQKEQEGGVITKPAPVAEPQSKPLELPPTPVQTNPELPPTPVQTNPELPPTPVQTNPKLPPTTFKECGKYSYDELLDKRLEELHAILKEKGIKDSSAFHNTQQAAEMICNTNKYGEMCGEENDYQCGDGRICDISSTPGICVDRGTASRNKLEKIAWIDYNGQQIIGSPEAIKALRKKLGLHKYKEPVVDPLSAEGINRSRMIKRASRITGETEDVLRKLSNAQLYIYTDGYEIAEKRERSRLIDELSRKDRKRKSELPEMSLQELYHRAAVINTMLKAEKAAEKLDRESMIETLASWLGQDPSYFAKWSTLELKQRIEAIEKWDEEKPGKKTETEVGEAEKQTDEEEEAEKQTDEEEEAEKQTDEEEEEEKQTEEEEEAEKQTEEEEEEEKKEDTDEEEDEEKAPPSATRHKHEDIDKSDVEKVLTDLMSGKKGQIEDFSDIQNGVLKCLGLIKA